MNVILKTIDHKSQRYETCGDWWIEHPKDGERELHIRVSSMGNWKYEALVYVHELVEALICEYQGVQEESVTAFDIEFERQREEGNHDEPGDDHKAPYRTAHFIATTIERVLAVALGVDWTEYERAIPCE